MSEKRKTAIKKTVKKRNKRRKKKLALFFAAFITLAFILLIVLSTTVFFPVKNIVVEGECGYEYEQIIKASGIDGDNIIVLSGDKVAERISRELPECGEITIKKKFPDTVKIIVSAAVPKYYFALEDVIYITDSNFKVIKRTLEPPTNGILIKLSKFEDTEPGEKIIVPSEDKTRMDEIFSLCEERGIKVSGIDISDEMNMKIIVENRLLVLLGGRMDLVNKLVHLEATLPKMEDGAQGTMDLRNWTSTNAKATFRDEKINILEFKAQKAQKTDENS